MNTPPASITSAIAEIKTQNLSMLFGTDYDDADDFDGVFSMALLSQIQGLKSAPLDILSALIKPASAQAAALHAGRNMALPDPESAYRMMSLINSKDVDYKAQYFELSRMGEEVARLQQAGQRLRDIGTDAKTIEAALQGFVGQYNDWIRRFEPDMQDGGPLAGTRAAQLSRYELEQSVRYLFNGAGEGLHGLGDIGISVGPGGTLALDDAKLDAMLRSNRNGVAAVTREFGANFARAAELLNAERNFIPSQLDNLDRAIRYITANHAAWQAEFGTGDAARPAAQVAKALSAYNRANAI